MPDRPEIANSANSANPPPADRPSAIDLLREAFDAMDGDQPCRLDHHGYCQEHYGDPCLVSRIREFLDRPAPLTAQERAEIEAFIAQPVSLMSWPAMRLEEAQRYCERLLSLLPKEE